MRNKIVFYYQKLSLIQKLSIPLLMASVFGFILTIAMVKQVQYIDNNTIFLKDELIPTLEKSNNNIALLRKISENLTFAILAAEEEMVLDINDNRLVERNLQDIIENENLYFDNIELYLFMFQNYFKISKSYALKIIESSSLNEEDGESAKELLLKHNELKEYFKTLKHDVENEINFRTKLINKSSSEVIYYTIIFLVVFAIVLFFTSYINYNELSDYDVIEAQRKELERVNINLQSSIEYAFLIQEAILPLNKTLDKYTKDNFVFWKQKDAVGGDIYFTVELESEQEILVMVIDGVGHGVAGAFLTILVKAIETQIVARINNGLLEPSPAKILAYFNTTIKVMLKQEKGSKSNTGFDGGVLYYNSLTNECKYAGAKTPLYIIRDDTLEVIKSDRANVGFIRTQMNQEYTEYDVKIEEGTKLYITTDGIIDQEGKDNRRYGKKKFEELILANNSEVFQVQKETIKNSFINFKAQYEQSDDITIMGIQFI
jgi:serine phosphatase RsbU (regulator of sigma subunit)